MIFKFKKEEREVYQFYIKLFYCEGTEKCGQPKSFFPQASPRFDTKPKVANSKTNELSKFFSKNMPKLSFNLIEMPNSETNQFQKKQYNSVAEDLFMLAEDNAIVSKNNAQIGDAIIMTSHGKLELNILQNFDPHAFFIIYGKNVLEQTDAFAAQQKNKVDFYFGIQKMYQSIMDTQDSPTISPQEESSLLICFSQVKHYILFKLFNKKNSQKFLKSIDQYQVKASIVGKVKSGNNKTRITEKNFQLLQI